MSDMPDSEAPVTEDEAGISPVDADGQSVGQGEESGPSTADVEGPRATDPAPGSEDYRLDYRRPEGIDPHVDQRFRSFAHENGIKGELAQKLIDFNNSLEAARAEELAAQSREWESEIRSLPGWQGRNYGKNMAVANRALKTFASPGLASLIKDAGYASHPEVVQTFYKVGRLLSEDAYVDSNRSTPREKTIGEILYPNQPV